MIVGHERVLDQLRDRLPPVSLFQGPWSVGKWVTALEMLQNRAREVRTFEQLDAEASREVVAFLSVRSFLGPKAVVARLDGASEEALNGLLKTLEQPPTGAYVILCSTARPMLTVASRASRYPFGYLTDEQVATVLMSMGWPDEDADWASARSGGQVSRALDAVAVEASRQSVLSLLKGAADGDLALVSNALVKFAFDPEQPQRAEHHLVMLRRWASEARTGRWRVYSPSESFGLHLEPSVIERVRRSTTSGARPRVAARAALMPVAMERARGQVSA